MSEASKAGASPDLGGATPRSVLHAIPEHPGGDPQPTAQAAAAAAASLPGPDIPPLGPAAAHAHPPPPEEDEEEEEDAEMEEEDDDDDEEMEDDDDDDDEDPKALLQAAEEGRAPAAPGAAQAGHPPPSPAQLVQKAHELMWYVLVKDQQRMVLWFPDMVKDVIGSYKKWCRSILRRTSLILARVFGLHLRLASLHTMEFSLVKALEPEELDRMALGNRMPMTGLLLMILSLIYVKGRGARESAVWNVLRILGLRPWKKHSTFADVRRLITEEFVQLNYLKYQRVPFVEPPEYEFFWGPRANREITKLQIMEFLSRVFKKDPQAWPSRYREALEEARILREAQANARCPCGGSVSRVSED